MKPVATVSSKITQLALACTLCAATLAITACGEKPPKSPLPKTEPTNSFQQQRSTLERSKKTGQTGEENTEDLKQNIDQQTK